jgi:hypothetical protein
LIGFEVCGWEGLVPIENDGRWIDWNRCIRSIGPEKRSRSSQSGYDYRTVESRVN